MRIVEVVAVGALVVLSGAVEGFCADDPIQVPPLVLSSTEIRSEDPAVHLNYATILFYKGRAQMSKGENEAATATFREVETELGLAMKLSEHDSDDVRRRLLRSQAAFLLGDVSFFVLKDRDNAKAFYQESIKNFPQHVGAAEALKRFE